MKLYNKHILEAINRGIRLALDDIDINDIETPISAKNDIISNDNYLFMNYILNVVDLGLPSGTLWCKYNLGVDPNNLSKPENWYGHYYSWGESEPKNDYSWETYNKFGTKNNLTKYNSKDGLTKLLLEDDAAYLYDNRFIMPTRELFQELIDNTTSKWISGKNDDLYLGIKGLAGRVFTSKINGELLFIPASGNRYYTGIRDTGSYCRLWTSNLIPSKPYCACYLYFNSRIINDNHDNRCYGLAIRPVLNKN